MYCWAFKTAGQIKDTAVIRKIPHSCLALLIVVVSLFSDCLLGFVSYAERLAESCASTTGILNGHLLAASPPESRAGQGLYTGLPSFRPVWSRELAAGPGPSVTLCLALFVSQADDGIEVGRQVGGIKAKEQTHSDGDGESDRYPQVRQR